MGVAEQECGQIREMWYIYITEHDTYIYTLLIREMRRTQKVLIKKQDKKRGPAMNLQN